MSVNVQQEFQKLAAQIPGLNPFGPQIELVSLSHHKPTPQQWLWAHRIPLNHVTILAGAPGTGKSLLSLDLAARLSCAQPLPGTPAHRGPIGSLILSDEDTNSTIRRRLESLGADLDKIRV